MSIWKKILGKTKKEEPKETSETSEEETIEEVETEEDKPLAEYHETLHTGKSTSKKSSSSTTKQSIWRNVDSIEENIDKLHISKAEKPVSNLEKKVDTLISKTKTKHKKTPNVVYVLSNPQPGEVRGDWAVKNEGNIISHHKTKENAIDAARKIAREKDATVMVQNTDGTFSEGFKPK